MADHKAFDWSNRSVFVTGANGLLGSWLVAELVAQGAYVTVLIRDQISQSLFVLKGLDKQVRIAFGDLSDFASLQRILNECDIEVVFHLGAQAIVGHAHRSPLSTFHSNIEGTWNLLEACRLSPWVKKIIVASSDKAYGDSDQLPYTEVMPLQGKHPYDVSKSCADLLAQSYFHTYNLPVCVTRCGNIFGGGDLHFNRIIPGTIRSVLDGERPVIRSNGLLVRDYVYVQDIVNAYLLLAQKMDDPAIVGQVFNFSEEQPMTVFEVVEAVLQTMEKGEIQPLIQGVVTGEITAQYLSCSKAQEMLGWNPSFGFKKGLLETIDWYKAFFKKNNFYQIDGPIDLFSSKTARGLI